MQVRSDVQNSQPALTNSRGFTQAGGGGASKLENLLLTCRVILQYNPPPQRQAGVGPSQMWTGLIFGLMVDLHALVSEAGGLLQPAVERFCVGLLLVNKNKHLKPNV